MKKGCNIFLALLSVLIISCEKEFIPKELEEADKLTVNCLFDNNGAFHVYLTKSFNSVENSKFSPVADASVELFENDVFKELLQYVPSDSLNTFGSYQSFFVPVPGNKYAVKIHHPVYGEVVAEDLMPNITRIISDSLITTGKPSQDKDAVLEISFDDDPAVENFYRLNPWMWLSRKVYDPVSGDTTDQITYQGIRVETEEALSDSVRDNGWALLFSDKNFNGQHKTLRLHFNAIRVNQYDQIHLSLDLNSVSSAHFEYFRTLDRYKYTRHEDDWTDVYGNIENGYGIFAGSAVSSKVIIVK